MTLLPLTRRPESLRSGRRWLTGGSDLRLLMATGLLAMAAGFVTVHSPKLAAAMLAAAAVALLFAVRPVALGVVAIACVVVVRRIGTSISVSDVLTAAATAAALPALAAGRAAPQLAVLRRWLGVYLVALCVSLVVNPSPRSLLELLHRAVLVGGATTVGAWVEQEGQSRRALSLLTVFSAVIAVAACVTSVANGFASAYPLGLHKNFAGSILSMMILLVVIAPTEVFPSEKLAPWRIPMIVLLSLGLAATQSRAAIFGVITGLFLWFFRTHRDVRRRSFIGAVLLATTFAVFSVRTIEKQYTESARTGVTVNSITIRSRVEAQTRRIWHTSPMVGVGIRYYTDPKWLTNYYVQAPTNLIDEALAEGGIVEAAGLLLFLGGSVWVLFRRREPLAIAALALVVAHVVHGALDIYWTAGNSALPWFVAGIAIQRIGSAHRAPTPALAPRA